MQPKIISLILLIALLTSCASMTDRQRTQVEGTGVGAAAGAGLGAIIGAIAGGKDGAWKGAVAGGLVGALGGFALGTHVANQKAKYANDEDYLDAVIANARQVNEETKQYNAYLDNEIQKLDQETALLVRQYNQKKITKVALNNEKAKLEAKLAESEKVLQAVKNELAIQKRVLKEEQGQSQAQLNALQAQIVELERHKAELEQQVDTLASIKTRVSV
jgi:hypothetical protein